MFIQRLAEKDIPEVLHFGACEAAFEMAEGCAFWTAKQLTSWSQSKNDVLLVARDDDGFLLGFSLAMLHKPTRKATWENLYVVPSARRSGIGDALAQETIKQLLQKGASCICFLVSAENKAALSYFRQHYDEGKTFTWFMA